MTQPSSASVVVQPSSASVVVQPSSASVVVQPSSASLVASSTELNNRQQSASICKKTKRQLLSGAPVSKSRLFASNPGLYEEVPVHEPDFSRRPLRSAMKGSKSHQFFNCHVLAEKNGTTSASTPSLPPTQMEERRQMNGNSKLLPQLTSKPKNMCVIYSMSQTAYIGMRNGVMCIYSGI